MRTRSFLAAVVVLVSASAFAGDPRLGIVGQQKPGSFKIVYEGSDAPVVTMKIYDEQGETVFSKSLYGIGSFIQPVDFSAMRSGEYTVEVTDRSGSLSQKFAYAKVKSIGNAHVARLADSGKYLLAVPDGGTREIQVSIFDGNKNLVHSEDRTIQGNFGLVYNLHNVAGVPTFEITQKDGMVYPLQ